MNSLQFIHRVVGLPLAGMLSYISKDYAIDFKPCSKNVMQTRMGRLGASSIAFDTLEILIDIETRALLYPRGYFPNTSWRNASLPSFTAEAGIVVLQGSFLLVSGVALSFPDSQYWQRYYDQRSGWLYFGPSPWDLGECRLEFAENSILSLTGHHIVSLWMKPSIDGPLTKRHSGHSATTCK